MELAAAKLESLVAAAAHRALACGALVPIPTRETIVRDGEWSFLVRIVGQLARKAAAASPVADASSRPTAAPRNPFLPYDSDLFVTDLPPAHVCLLNKFNVVDHHVLVVTRAFERQTAVLNRGDFAALAVCMLDGTRFAHGLGFYNGGTAAGASQAHKHLQWLPVPPSDFPLTGAIEAAAAQGLSQCESLPFAHRIDRLSVDERETPYEVGGKLESSYGRLLEQLGVDRPADSTASDFELPPYNLLMARNWMMIVPRRAEHFLGISLNALAFVGALLVKDELQWQVLSDAGPCAALAAVAPPHPPNVSWVE